jgi:hypothetical protein
MAAWRSFAISSGVKTDDVVLLDLHLLDLLRGRHWFGWQAVLGAGVGEEHLDADEHRIARTGGNRQSASPGVDVRGADAEDFAGEGGTEAVEDCFEL